MTAMNRRDFLRLGAACIPAALSVGALARTARPGADFSWLDARLRERVERGYFDGMTLVLGRGDQVLHQACFGNGDPGQVLHVASMGKWSAAATIAVLVDEGRLGWDDPVRKFLPQFSDIKGRATLRQLMSHTAGYPDYQPQGARRDDYATLEEAVAHIVPLPAVAAPGTLFQYGGLAMQVAGRMAELAAGQLFDEIFQSRIAAPLGMRSSGYAPVSAEPGFSPMLGGSLYTSAHDFARFLAMLSQRGLHQGRRLLSAAALAEMQADQVRQAQAPAGQYVELARQDLRRDMYGLGQWREELDGAGLPSLVSSPGWAGAYAWLDHARQIWGVVLAKANVERAAADGYNTFLGSSIYAPMARTALEELEQRGVQRGSVELDGGASLYYEASGAGEALIFLHGHSLDRRQWRPQVAEFERSHRVIRYDLRGYGRSSAPLEDQPFLHADDLRRLMDALRVPRAHLVGLSLGGFVVTDFIALYPERALSATMAGGDLRDAPGPDEPWTAGGLAARRGEIAALKSSGIAPFKRRWLEDLMRNAGSNGARIRPAAWRMIDEWAAWQPLHAEPRLLLGRSAIARLAAVKPTLPVLLMRGDLERIATRVLDLLPQARIEIIQDCGHLSNMEQPEKFSAAVRAFIGGGRQA